MRNLWLLVAAVCITLATSCGSNHRKPATWRTSDDVHIAVDETFRDIMEEEIETFGLLWLLPWQPAPLRSKELIKRIISRILRNGNK